MNWVVGFGKIVGDYVVDYGLDWFVLVMYMFIVGMIGIVGWYQVVNFFCNVVEMFLKGCYCVGIMKVGVRCQE